MPRIAWFRCVGAGVSRVMNGMYFTSFVCTSLKYVHACFTNSGLVSRSSTVMACALAPATTPLWAIGVALAMPLDQLWPGSPGMFAG